MRFFFGTNEEAALKSAPVPFSGARFPVRFRLKMEGGDEEWRNRYFNSWAAGHVTNAQLRQTLKILEGPAVRVLKASFGEGPVVTFLKQITEAFGEKFDEKEILG